MLQNPKIYVKIRGCEALFDTAAEAIRYLDNTLYDGGEILVGIEDDFTRECVSVFDVQCDPVDLVLAYASRLND